VLLLDEPLSALDAKLREQMRFELTQLQDQIGVTFLIVTHDQDEALAMASRCAVMNKGLLQQVGTPSDLYEFPNSRFVADFIGQVNIFEGRLSVDAPDHAEITCPELSAPVFLDHGVTGATGATAWVALRPEKIELTGRQPGTAPPKMEDAPQGANIIAGEVRHIVYLGSESLFEVELDSGTRVKALRTNLTRWDQEDFAVGQPVWLAWHACSPAVLLS
jgi:spermidine/putrescine transport system ATP-binding protein